GTSGLCRAPLGGLGRLILSRQSCVREIGNGSPRGRDGTASAVVEILTRARPRQYRTRWIYPRSHRSSATPRGRGSIRQRARPTCCPPRLGSTRARLTLFDETRHRRPQRCHCISGLASAAAIYPNGTSQPSASTGLRSSKPPLRRRTQTTGSRFHRIAKAACE